MTRRWTQALGLGLVAVVASAHVGTLDTFFAGKAGPYDVQVTVRPPGVVPGRAQILVRLDPAGVTRVTTQAAYWNVGSAGAPPPDEAIPVPGTPGLYSSELWMMTAGSYSVNVGVEGAGGKGTAIVPVASLATKRLDMKSSLGWTLAGLGLFLFIGMLTIIRAAAKEGNLPPGVVPEPSRAWRVRGIVAVGGVILIAALAGGWQWWDSVDRAYSRGLYRALHATPAIRVENGARILRLTIDDDRWTAGQVTPIVPDHGKMMHLFLVRSPSLDAFAHLHPTLIDPSTFDVRLGALPAGQYRIYADIVHESGLSETMTGQAEVGEPLGAGEMAHDPDDAMIVGSAAPGDTARLSDGMTIVWHRPASLEVGTDAPLRFSVRGPDGAPAQLEPYLGMPGHAMVSRDDGNVFMHLHGMGSISLVAQQVLQAIERGDTLASKSANDRWPRAILPGSDSTHGASHPMAVADGGALTFPFAFPEPGRYRIWVQVKRGGRVETGAFEAQATAPATR